MGGKAVKMEGKGISGKFLLFLSSTDDERRVCRLLSEFLLK